MKAALPEAMQKLAADELLIHEFFHSVQGESTRAGEPCFFIRLTGCHLRCTWCDTPYAFYQGSVHTIAECVAKAVECPAKLVEVTGGEPLLQEAAFPLLKALCDAGLDVLLETSGAVAIDRVDPRVARIVDWKCPGSGMAEHNHPAVLPALRPGDELKLVIADRGDYEWARTWMEKTESERPPEVPLHFSPAFGRLSPQELVDWILSDGLDVRLNLQIHKWIWPPETRGV